MVIIILGAMLLAKIKGNKISFLFTTWIFYPTLFLESVLFFFQVNAFWGNYYFVRFASFFKIVYLLSYLIPILYLKLYKHALIGSVSILFGTLLNNFVIAQNGGKMPVFPSLSYFTGYYKPESFQLVNDIHILGSATTHWKILTDYIDVGYSILSPGDLLVHFFSFIILYETIKALNVRQNSTSSSL